MEEFRNQLIQVINKCGLSFDCIYYIIKDVYREISDGYLAMLRDQQNQNPQIRFDDEHQNVKEEEKDNGTIDNRGEN